MTAPSVLFIGGNGIISAAASRLAVAHGLDLTLLTRGHGSWRPPIAGARQLQGDATDAGSIACAIGAQHWDIVVNFHVFTGSQAREQVDLFSGRTGQYVFISSAAAYGKPVQAWPIVESAALGNPFWEYAQGKIAAEEVFASAHAGGELPVTVVRPSHTYDASLIPLPGEWTTLARMRQGRPIIIHGDGTSVWTLTHQKDFAIGLVGLLGLPAAIGEAVHITTDLVLTWDQVAHAFAAALGTDARIVHVASDTLARLIPAWGPPLLGDWSYTEIYDNTKIRHLVPGYTAPTPFTHGAQEIVDWYLADRSRQAVDGPLDATIDQIISRFG